MLFPGKVKHRKWMKGHRRAVIESRGNELAFGSFGLQVERDRTWAAHISTASPHTRRFKISRRPEWITGRQIEAARRVISRAMKKGGKLWIRVFPDKPITRKGTEVPMGGGKGAVSHFVYPARPGKILFEIDGISEELAREAFKLAGYKMPVRTRFVKR